MWQPTHLKVTVKQAKNLISKGKNGTNDAFVVIGIGKEKYQTSIKEKSSSPVEWREECELAIPSQGNKANVQLAVYHHNGIGLDEFLGQIALPLSDFDVYEKPKYRAYRLKGKPEKDKKKGEKERGELEVMVNFTVKSESFLDVGKKEKHKTSLSSLKHLGGSLMSIGAKEKQGLKNFAKSVSSKMDKIAKPKKKKKSKAPADNLSRLPNDLMTSQQRYGDADPGVISDDDDDDDDFRFDDDIKVNTRTSSPLSTMSRGSSIMHEQVLDTDYEVGSYEDHERDFSNFVKSPSKPPRIVDETKESVFSYESRPHSNSSEERITSFSEPKPTFKITPSTPHISHTIIEEESSFETKEEEPFSPLKQPEPTSVEPEPVTGLLPDDPKLILKEQKSELPEPTLESPFNKPITREPEPELVVELPHYNLKRVPREPEPGLVVELPHYNLNRVPRESELGPVVELPISNLKRVPKEPESVVELPISNLKWVPKEPEPVVELPISNLKWVPKEPEPVVELPISNLKWVPKEPEPVVELPISNLKWVPKEPEPVVELPISNLKWVPKEPEPVVELPISNLKRVPREPEPEPVVEIPISNIKRVPRKSEAEPVMDLVPNNLQGESSFLSARSFAESIFNSSAEFYSPNEDKSFCSYDCPSEVVKEDCRKDYNEDLKDELKKVVTEELKTDIKGDFTDDPNENFKENLSFKEDTRKVETSSSLHSTDDPHGFSGGHTDNLDAMNGDKNEDRNGRDSAISLGNDQESVLSSAVYSRPRSTSNASSTFSSTSNSNNCPVETKDAAMSKTQSVFEPEPKSKPEMRVLLKSSSDVEVVLRHGLGGRRLDRSKRDGFISDVGGPTMVRSGSFSEKRTPSATATAAAAAAATTTTSQLTMVDEWERKLYGRSGMTGSTENVSISGSRSSLNTSRESSTHDIRKEDSFTRLPEVKALRLEKTITDNDDEGKKQKQKKPKSGLKNRFFSKLGGSRERLNEEGRIVEGGNDRLPSIPSRSKLPQEVHDKFAGKSREDLLEVILNLQDSLEKQAKHSSDLEEYIDNLLLRVMEATPHILQVPIKTGTGFKE